MSTKYELIALGHLQDYRDAIAKKDIPKMDAAADAFEDSVLMVEDYNREVEFRAAFEALANAIASDAFKVFGESAKKLGALKNAFELGKAMAEGGQEELFFPSAAAELASFSGSLIALKDAVEVLKDNIGNVSDAYKAEDVEKLIDELKVSKDEVQNLLGAFEELKGTFQANE
jgi:hypothetical protein